MSPSTQYISHPLSEQQQIEESQNSLSGRPVSSSLSSTTLNGTSHPHSEAAGFSRYDIPLNIISLEQDSEATSLVPLGGKSERDCVDFSDLANALSLDLPQLERGTLQQGENNDLH